MKTTLALMAALAMAPMAVHAQNINFGDDSSEWANDGECDDRRFRGVGMAKGLDRDDVGRDATDCKTAFDDGRIKLWVAAESMAATQCSAIRFGNDKGDWPNDGECDDYRFEGPGTDSIMLSEDIGRDATDCRKACEFGQVSLRDY